MYLRGESECIVEREMVKRERRRRIRRVHPRGSEMARKVGSGGEGSLNADSHPKAGDISQMQSYEV